MNSDDLDLEHIEDWLDDTLLDLMNKGIIRTFPSEEGVGFELKR